MTATLPAAGLHLNVPERGQVAHEWHTSDLTAECFRAVRLRHDGKIIGETPTAMYRGMVFGQACSLWHLGAVARADCVSQASFEVEAQRDSEGAPITKAVSENRADILAEVEAALSHYIARFGDYFAASKLIGCEVPVRMEIDGRPFASHIDLLFRDPKGVLRVWDWKWRDESVSHAYVNRNMQFRCYWLAVGEGSVMLGDEWVEMGEYPTVSYVSVPQLYPYKKAGSAGDRQWAKGDPRPLDTIVHDMAVFPCTRAALLSELRTRFAMAESDLWPVNPGAERCFLCPSRHWCPVGAEGDIDATV